MAGHLDENDLKYPILAAGILGRHEHNEPEANITSAVRDFLIQTGLLGSPYRRSSELLRRVT